ncbi:MAG: phage tail protein [Chloroflexi bacterium]|nr:phage tail protein [Chloroflexota bacterium]
MNGNGPNYLYLNRDNGWPDFQMHGLVRRDDGSLTLFPVPLLDGVLPPEVARLPAPDLPAGIVVGPDGSLYYTQPEAQRIIRLDVCDSEALPLPCLGGEGTRPAQFDLPRGLAYHPLRGALLVADSRNHRVQVFDLETLQLVGVWGRAELATGPQPGTAPGRFDTPVALAVDDAGSVYVVDYGNWRVQKLDLNGRPISAFWDTIIAGETAPGRPVGVATSGRGDEAEVTILDTNPPRVLVYDTQGHYRRTLGEGLLLDPLALAADEQGVYVGDNGLRRVIRLALDGSYAEAAVGYQGPIAALALDPDGALWLHPGGTHAPLRLTLDRGYTRSGVLWGGPFEGGAEPVIWNQVRALAGPLPDGAHLRLFTYIADQPTSAPPDPTPGDLDPFDTRHSPWCALPPDVLDGLIQGRDGDGAPAFYPAGRWLWIGAHLTGEGRSTPILPQVRVDFDHEGYLQHLPAIYATSPQRDTLARLLGLFESLFAGAEGQIAGLDRYFDVEAVPAAWLPWLAGWLGLELDERWSEAYQREALAGAFALYAWRGTAEGLRRALKFFAGVEAIVESPIQYATWWALPGADDPGDPDVCTSVLGFTTRLAPAEPDGAVVGTTATLDHAHLISGEEYGVPLFESVAHRFTVQVYQGQAPNTCTLDTIRGVIEREKPAHTDYRLCVIEPKMRLGFQARIGIDTVIGSGAAQGAPLGEGDLVARGEPPGTIGDRSEIGRSTRLGTAAAGS